MAMKTKILATVATLAASALLNADADSINDANTPDRITTFYRTTQVDGLTIFYREAGPKDAPVILLLHGFPTSSRMFDSLLPTLGRRYHLVAPDYPGFGHSDAPDAKSFCVYLDHLALVMEHF